MGGDPGAGGRGGVRRPVVADQVNVQARVSALVEAVQEAGEGDRVVAVDRLDHDLPRGDPQRGGDGDGAVSGLLELPAGPAAPGRAAPPEAWVLGPGPPFFPRARPPRRPPAGPG